MYSLVARLVQTRTFARCSFAKGVGVSTDVYLVSQTQAIVLVEVGVDPREDNVRIAQVSGHPIRGDQDFRVSVCVRHL